MAKRRKSMTRAADAVDRYVGARIRARRTVVGMSQGELGDVLGVSFQQVQKYEKGANRVGASRLVAIAKALEVTPAWFYEGMPGDPNKNPRKSDEIATFLLDPFAARVVTAFPGLAPDVKREIVSLMERTTVN